MHWFNGYTGIHGGMMIGMFFFWGLLIILAFYLMKNYINGNNRATSTNYMDILKERLAKGEITEEEYERLKTKLMQ
ncbi:SHOCT domain-containing protein [Bacillus sp. FJAT-47783]|uniref:SHOCT domain-containing protein n=1 Tax=Bacillus sp. FJAT-47783 TaxID=2922712 RepID=UPI001FADF02E|nr:SHOCT domain-containing protein [Bacillus sp. FJAT-47783]